MDEYKSESRMRNMSRREVQYYFILYLVIILASHILTTSKGIGTRVVAAMNLFFQGSYFSLWNVWHKAIDHSRTAR